MPREHPGNEGKKSDDSNNDEEEDEEEDDDDDEEEEDNNDGGDDGDNEYEGEVDEGEINQLCGPDYWTNIIFDVACQPLIHFKNVSGFSGGRCVSRKNHHKDLQKCGFGILVG